MLCVGHMGVVAAHGFSHGNLHDNPGIVKQVPKLPQGVHVIGMDRLLKPCHAKGGCFFCKGKGCFGVPGLVGIHGNPKIIPQRPAGLFKPAYVLGEAGAAASDFELRGLIALILKTLQVLNQRLIAEEDGTTAFVHSGPVPVSAQETVEGQSCAVGQKV